MAKHTTKFGLGQEVSIKHAPNIKGMVTAVFIREKGFTNYEVSYTIDNPTNCVCAEMELIEKKTKKVGF